MAYDKTVWKNREVERPRTFEKIENSDGTITLVPAEGNIIEPGTPIIAENMNNIEQGIEDAHNEINAHKADYVYQKAGGTATAITLTINNLKDGYPITFIATANNNGAATTINSKPLYKPNTIQAPNLVTGKAYTVWYNSINNCFFIKASAEGNASVEDVLAGKTFSNDNDTGLTGTMPNNGKISRTITTQGGQIVIPKGYHDGSGIVKAELANLVASNIKKGVNVGGVVGTYNNGIKILQGTFSQKLSNSQVAWKYIECTGEIIGIVVKSKDFGACTSSKFYELGSSTPYFSSKAVTLNSNGSSVEIYDIIKESPTKTLIKVVVYDATYSPTVNFEYVILHL